MALPPSASTLFPYTTLFRSPPLVAVGVPQCRRVAGLHAQGLHARSEEHTSELQSLRHLVCRLLLEKKNMRKRQKKLSVLILICAPWICILCAISSHEILLRQ